MSDYKIKSKMPISYDAWVSEYEEYLYEFVHTIIDYLRDEYDIVVEFSQIQDSICHFLYTQSSKRR